MGTITFSTSAIEDIFEVRVPRIQIRYYEEEKMTRTPSGTSEHDDDVESDRRALRREIRQWWECVSDHVDKIVCHIVIIVACSMYCANSPFALLGGNYDRRRFVVEQPLESPSAIAFR
jgi:hypothetical protein